MSVAVAHDETQSDDGELKRLLRDATASFARRGGVERSRALRTTRPGMDVDAWKQMAEQGWLGILVPETYGGQALGFGEMAVVVEELAKTLSPEPVVASSVLSATLLIGSDNDALKTALLPKIASGECIVGAAVAGRFSQAAGVTAKTTGGDAVLNGVAYHVYPALSATDFIVAAKGVDGVGLYHVPAHAAGLTVKDELRVDGTFSGTLTFKDVKTAGLVAKGAKAEAALARATDAATIMTCAELFGGMNQALEITLGYMRTRVQFGKPIGSFQALQHRAVDLWIQKELSIGALADAVRTLDDPKATAEQVSMAASRAKSRLGDAAHTIGREAVKLHGAIGFTDEYDVGLYLRRAMALNAWLGNPAEHRRRYATLLQKTGGEAAKKRESVPFSTVFLQDDKADVDWNSFSDEEFRAGVFAWFDKNYPHDMRHTGRRGSAQEMSAWMKTIARKGWIAPAWPTKWGGMGLSPAKQIIYIEERERVGVMRDPDMGIVMFGPMLMRWGSDEQKQKYLPRIVANEDIWCQGYSEPNAGSDLASLQTTAVLDGDHYVINGSKIWTSSGHWADHMFLLARTDKDAKKQEGITFFVLDMKTPGLTVRPIMNIGGHEEFAQEYLENVRIPKENVVGEVNKGWTVAKSLLGFERLNSGSPRPARAALMAVERLAKATGVWDDAEFQAKYVRVYLDIADLSTAYQRFADIMSLGDSPGPELSQLKIIVASATQLASELLMETAGGAGANLGYEAVDGDAVNLTGAFFGHFGAMIASGTNDIQRNIIAKRILNLP
ncbi:acyl-CoA dehydrogenase [Bradyrhizobium sp. LHD-71]|uniref:acyl-CoA dehydrogenase n=1 Tax=Bradyrhizobium sp. LHD-71 TaxID=3072141 RepID=UPI00280E825C|nr:acyl-CoA dehydrogenase [Bradyrhizobium sp. LHD-71]MDQ8730822.1 acyl-CoA dehydrogenase [Bradyrhizobium sp. LHD-71]